MISKQLEDQLDNVPPQRRAYMLQYLAQHLFAATQFDRLHSLISHDWMGTRLKYDTHYGGFLSDVGLAWSSTLQAPQPQVALQVRYALIQSSVNSLAAAVPPVLFPLFLEHGFWNFDQAITFALQIPELEQRCEALIRLGQVPELSSEDKRSAFMGAFNVKWPYQAEEKLVLLLRSVAPFLPSDLFPEAYRLVQELHSVPLRQAALSALAPYSHSHQKVAIFAEALALARSFEEPPKRAEALANLAPLLTHELLAETLEQIAQSSSTTHTQYECLQKIAGYVPVELHPRAIAISGSSPDIVWHAVVLIALASQQVLQTQTLLQPYGWQAIPKQWAPPPLLSQIKDRELTEASRILQSLPQDEEQRKNPLLFRLAAFLPDLQERALNAAIVSGQQPGIPLIVLAAHVKPEHVDKAITALRLLSGSQVKQEVIRAIASILVPEQIHRLISSLEEIFEKKYYRLQAIGILVFYLTKTEQVRWVKEAHRLANSIDDRGKREEAINKITNFRFGSPQPGAVFEAAGRKISLNKREKQYLFNEVRNYLGYKQLDNWSHVSGLCQILAQLDGELIKEVIDLCLELATVSKAPFIAYLVGKIAPFIPEDYLLRVLDFCVSEYRKPEGYADTVPYFSALADLANCFPASFLPNVLNSMQSIENPNRRKYATLVLANYLYNALSSGRLEASSMQEYMPILQSLWKLNDSQRRTMDDIVETVKELPNHYARHWIFLSMLPYIPAKFFDEALTESWELITGFEFAFEHVYFKQLALLRITPLAPIEQYTRIVDMLDKALNVEPARIEVLELMPARFLATPIGQSYELWNNLLLKLANRDRLNFLEHLAIFIPVLNLLGGQKALDNIAQSILEISTWW